MMNRREFLSLCSSAALAAPVAAGLNRVFTPAAPDSARHETSFERVVRTGSIRCAYAEYNPSFMIDPNSRQFSGIFYDVTTLIGQHLGLKIEWVEEVDYGLIPQGFKAGRYDLFGGTIWPVAERGKVSNFTNPVYVSPVGVYVRADDKRLTSLKDIDNPNCRIAIKDGDITDSIMRSSFPSAKRWSLPQMAAITQLLQDVAANKADVTFVEPFCAEDFMKSNPGTLKNIAAREPVRVYGNTLMFDNDDWRFKTMMDGALQELQGAGIIPKLIEKYTGSPHTFFLVPRPYLEPGT